MSVWDDIQSSLDIAGGILHLIVNFFIGLVSFFISLVTMGGYIINMLTGTIGVLFSANVYATTVFYIISMIISLVVIFRVWNIISDIQLFGWKLPKIPL